MSTDFPPVETDVPRLRVQFRSSCNLLLNLLRNTEIFLPFTPDPPLPPVSSLTPGFRNVSTSAGDTPRRCLDLSNLSNGEEETAFNFSQSPRSLDAGQKDSAEPQDNHIDSRRQCTQLLQTEVLCSTPGIPDCIHQIIWEINSPSMNKENKKGSVEEYEMKPLGSPVAALATRRMPEALGGFPELCPEELEETEVFALPAVMGRHQDLRYITSQTMAALLHDQFQSLIEKYCIIDCRYPYEYHGGHIKGALNIHRQDDLFEHFLRKPLLPSAPQKHLILVFHCEFSSERGPKMCRYLREEDRAMNEYPALLYPELYILEGGYKDFFLEYKEMCEPQSYCPMHHQDFQAEMLKFHVKSKTRAGEQKKRDQIAHLMKL